MQVVINRQKLGIEDLEWGTGTATQIRGGVEVSVTRINAADIPYDDLQTLSEAIAPIVTDIIPNLPEILVSADNAAIATTKAAEALNSANLAASLLDQFDDRYLGSKDADPILDNDGNTLLDGALYWNTSLMPARMRAYSIAGGWVDALTLSTDGAATLTNKTIDSITNRVGADHIHYKVRNESGSIIPVNTVVAASGTQPGTDYILVVPITNPQTQIALGVVHTALAINGIGLVVNTGVVDDINTSSWAVGTLLYPNTAGGFTSTKPTSGRYQSCAYVMRQHSTKGTLLCEFTEPSYISSTTQAGYVQLNNTLTSTSSTQALTAAQGKALNDRLATVETGTVQEGDSVTLTGDVTGTAVFDTNGNVSIEATVVDDGHNHVIDNVDGLQTVLDGKQPIDATLTALAGITTAADNYVYAIAADTFTTGTITAFGRSLVDDADAATARATLGVAAAEVGDMFSMLGTDLTTAYLANSVQLSEIQTVADVSGSLNNKYFIVYVPKTDTTSTVEDSVAVWFNVNSAGVQPVLDPIPTRFVPVALATNATADTVATAIASALATETMIGVAAQLSTTSTDLMSYVYIYNKTGLSTTPTSAGDSGFIISQEDDGGGSLSGTAKWAGGVLAPNGKIYGIPYNSTTVLEIDPSTKTTSTFGSLSGTAKWYGGVLAPNGKIYGIPLNSTTVLEIDPSTKTTSTFGSLSGTNKWIGGVLAPNGKIYGIPYNSTTVLEISTSNDTPKPYMLSAYINKF
jgi:hypothetical protein